MDLHTLCRILSYIYVALASRSRHSTNLTETFNWLQFDKRFDCIVAITNYNSNLLSHTNPEGIGTLINSNTVVTSANALLSYQGVEYANKTTYTVTSTIHGISKYWNRSEVLPAKKFILNLSHRSDEWIKMGFDKTNSPIHDIIFIKLSKPVKKPPPVGGREPFYLNEGFRSYFTHGLTFASFAPIKDRDWNSSQLALEPRTYDDSDEVDCDEWIPRAWGRFVCLLNVDNVDCFQSGAPLFQYGQLRGVGSFALTKGKESILVFTDFLLYREAYDEVTTDANKTTTTPPTNERHPPWGWGHLPPDRDSS